MADLPWWALSPSPWTVGLWILWTVWAARRIQPVAEYRRFKRLMPYLDAALTVAFVVCLLDLIYCLFILAKFGAFYPQSQVYVLVVAMGRDVFGALFFYLLIQNLFKIGLLDFSMDFFKAIACFALFMFVWVLFAPGLAWIDWTYAIRYDYPASLILWDFFLSHGVGRVFNFMVLYNLFRL